MDDDHKHQNHDHDQVCLGLGLGLGLTPKRDHQGKNKHVLFLDLSIPFQSSNDHNGKSLKIMGEECANVQGCKNNSSSSREDERDSNYCNDGFSRKKLRLTTDQTALLEDSFRQHTTLNTTQKQALAEKLKLKPRQVEVWFQNRRARTKLKQTEIDCEKLKKTCERLSEENRRLKKELFGLRSSLKITEKPPQSCASQPLPFLQYHISKSDGEKIGNNRGGGERNEEAAAAAAAEEVVHGIALAEGNDNEQKLGFVGDGKIKGEYMK